MTFHGEECISLPFSISLPNFIMSFLFLPPFEIHSFLVQPQWNLKSPSFNSPQALMLPGCFLPSIILHPWALGVSSSLGYMGCTLQSFYIMHCPAFCYQVPNHRNVKHPKFKSSLILWLGRLRMAFYNLSLFSMYESVKWIILASPV